MMTFGWTVFALQDAGMGYVSTNVVYNTGVDSIYYNVCINEGFKCR